MQKGDFIIENSSKAIYQIVGRWERDIVLAPTSEDADQVLIYTASELEGLVSQGYFNKLYKTGIKVDNTEEGIR